MNVVMPGKEKQISKDILKVNILICSFHVNIVTQFLEVAEDSMNIAKLCILNK